MSGREVKETGFAHIVGKNQIVESGDWNLSGERYREIIDFRTSKFEIMGFNEVCTLEYGASLPKRKRVEGKYPVIGSNGITGWHNEYMIKAPAIIVGRKGSAGEVVFIDKPCFPIDTTYYVKPVDKEIVDMKYLYHILKELDLPALKDGAGIPGLNRNDVYKTKKVPLPPLDVQKAIVAEIEAYQKIIDGARQVVDNYKPTIKIDPDWEMVELKTICDVRDGTHDSPKYQSKGYPLITTKNIKDGKIDFLNVNLISKTDLDKINKRSKVDDGDIIMPMIGTIGNPIVVKKDREFGIKNVALIKFLSKSKIDRYFLKFVLESDVFNKQYEFSSDGSSQKFISLKFIRSLKVPLPSLPIQKEIVAQIKTEQEIVNANKKLIQIFEQKIKDKISEVWGE